jgi:hypothetical protein
MDSDSDAAQYNISGTEDEKMEPHPPSQIPPISQAVQLRLFGEHL